MQRGRQLWICRARPASTRCAPCSARSPPGWVLIHRVDAELAAGGRTDLDPELAADGVDEMVRIMFGVPPWARWTTADRTLRVRTSDTAHSWHLTGGRIAGVDPVSGARVEAPAMRALPTDDGTRAASATVTATAADLDCLLWNRPPIAPHRVSRIGCTTTLAAFDRLGTSEAGPPISSRPPSVIAHQQPASSATAGECVRERPRPVRDPTLEGVRPQRRDYRRRDRRVRASCARDETAVGPALSSPMAARTCPPAPLHHQTATPSRNRAWPPRRWLAHTGQTRQSTWSRSIVTSCTASASQAMTAAAPSSGGGPPVGPPLHPAAQDTLSRTFRSSSTRTCTTGSLPHA